MPWNLLLLPLLGGYWFLRRCFYFRIRFQALEGYRVLLDASLVALILGVPARFFTIFVYSLCPDSREWWFEFLPPESFAFSGTAVGALLTAGFFAEVMNSFPYGPIPWPRRVRTWGLWLFGLTEAETDDDEHDPPRDHLRWVEQWKLSWARNKALAETAAILWHGDVLDRLFFEAAKEVKRLLAYR